MVVFALLAIITFPVTAALAALGSLVWPPPTGWPPARPYLRSYLRALAQPRPRKWRLLRVLLVAVVYLAAELVALSALGWLWVRSGFGRHLREPASERRHYLLVAWLLDTVYRLAESVLHVRVRIEGPSPDEYLGRPLVVFCRHAGPGDSLLIVHALLKRYDREPRIVLKDLLQLDPAIDIVLNRLPNRFVRAGRDRPVEAIADLATRLDGNDALVLFPEGGNFTARRRARAILKLRRRGMLAQAEKAERMRHVLPPRTAGVVAALGAQRDNPDPPDVVWVAHTGTDHLFSVGDVWRALPMDVEITMRWWRVPFDEIPADPQAQGDWLYAWWRLIDDWIEQNRPV
ncbi:1-acyl-sn-glycerol-3-phosphate acyltransferase [Spongisporangium articulatum]|uniref:1-acyl-sn-glycerol-3-phosphate acyltransferase n=1 Tax=Spongisporangium articulatum TaxID=3362603 RepID=A0ABW8AIK5_9ACTN